MVATHPSKSAAIRERLNHPVIDADGHFQEFTNLARGELLDYARQIGGHRLVERVQKTGDLTIDEFMVNRWLPMTEEERRDRWVPCPAWWSMPADTLDRATAHLPALLHERMDDLGIDFSVLYPSLSLPLPRIADEEVRRLACRVYNTVHAEIFRPHADRLTPAAIIPMNTPAEAIDELDHAILQLGLKAIVIGQIRRPVPHVARNYPEAAAFAERLEYFAIDSDYDYDPFWRRCAELKVAVGVHASDQSWGSRRSISRYAYNHIGAFGAAAEALCKAIFFGGVTRRFPTLNFAFLEGGVGWAGTLYADLIAHWEKRNGRAIQRLNPESLDRAEMVRLTDRYGPERYRAHLPEVAAFFARPSHRPAELDDWALCGIERLEDFRELFVKPFYFGCEADDPINAWAFNAKVNPLGARLRAIFGSDIGHWDVPDLSEVVAEAHELVERALLTPEDFRDFMFTNPAHLYAGANRDFFRGTRVEAQVAALPPAG
jgi:predicted TIM-barrel fold metal-dependent hydrolase